MYVFWAGEKVAETCHFENATERQYSKSIKELVYCPHVSAVWKISFYSSAQPNQKSLSPGLRKIGFRLRVVKYENHWSLGFLH